jgi:hypothetical protein
LEAVKMLRKELGLCDVGKEDSIHITKYLKRLSPIITENQLSESAAYELLTSVTGGLTNSFVCGRRDSKLPFVKLWGFLSVSRPPVVPLKKIAQEVDDLLKKGLQDPIIVLKEIAALWVSTSNGDDELQKRIADESALNNMRRYIHTNFASQASAIEIYFHIQSKVQKDEEKAKERSGLKPEFSLLEYMLYMNAVGSFLKPGLVEQKTETPKADSSEKGWQKVVFIKKFKPTQLRPKQNIPSFLEFVKSYNTFDKLRGEGKTSVGMSSELGKEKINKPSKPVSKPLKPRRVREGFCELCQLPGHVKKYCWTYPEEDVSDKPCDICEGRHGLSPCYFHPKMYKSIMRDNLRGNSI